MLIRYKNNLEKIAMGLLSFMPEEKNVKNLQQTIEHYSKKDNWHLYLWKQEDSYLGAIGIRVKDNMSVIIQHVTVDPSHRNLGIGRNMVNNIREMYRENYEVIANENVASFFNKCLEKEEN